MGFIMPIFGRSVGNLPLLSISLKIFSNEGSKNYCPCLIISFEPEAGEQGSSLIGKILHFSGHSITFSYQMQGIVVMSA